MSGVPGGGQHCPRPLWLFKEVIQVQRGSPNNHSLPRPPLFNNSVFIKLHVKVLGGGL